MSNKLKRKTPKETPQDTAYDRDWRLCEKYYSETFVSMQLICFTALYTSKEDGGFDFTRQKLQNFNKFITQHNHENVEGELSSKETEDWILGKFGISCMREAVVYPYRAKMKMVGKIKSGKMKIALASVETAIEAYLILAIYTLHKHYKFGFDDIFAWWKKCREIGELYGKDKNDNYLESLTDEYLLDFIKNEVDLEIVREG